MKKLITIFLPVLLLLSQSAYAGAVMDMVIMDASGQEVGRAKIYAQSNRIRMDELGGEHSDVSMIYLGDRLLYVDHDEKSYMVLDEAMMSDVSAQLNEAMAQLEKELAGMPPEQRAMLEEMMKGQLQDLMPTESAPVPAPRIESRGSGKWQSYDCKEYAIFDGDEKIQEVCAAELDGIAGADEAMQAFASMGEYIVKMAESMPMMSGQFNPGELMDEFDGFPVHTMDYENGELVTQSSLESISEKDLPPEMFAAPEGYRQQDPFAE